MKDVIRNLNWRRLIFISLLLSGLFGIFDTSGAFTQITHGNIGWKCPDGGTIDCRARGCVRSSDLPDSYWVCRYIGEACPPLEQCRP